MLLYENGQNVLQKRLASKSKHCYQRGRSLENRQSIYYKLYKGLPTMNKTLNGDLFINSRGHFCFQYSLQVNKGELKNKKEKRF